MHVCEKDVIVFAVYYVVHFLGQKEQNQLADLQDPIGFKLALSVVEHSIGVRNEVTSFAV